MNKYLIIFILLVNSILFAQENTIIKIDSVESKNGYYLEKMYPNPFSPINYINFNIPDSSNVKIFILQHKKSNDGLFLNQSDTTRIIFRGILEKGYYKSIWDWKNSSNQLVENGYYSFCISAYSEMEEGHIMKFSAKTKLIVFR
jgi:hypothetical protein